MLRIVGPGNLLLVASKAKLGELGGRPLLVDTGDREIDQLLSGYRAVITAYRDQILYPVSTALDALQ